MCRLRWPVTAGGCWTSIGRPSSTTETSPAGMNKSAFRCPRKANCRARICTCDSSFLTDPAMKMLRVWCTHAHTRTHTRRRTHRRTQKHTFTHYTRLAANYFGAWHRACLVAPTFLWPAASLECVCVCACVCVFVESEDSAPHCHCSSSSSSCPVTGH